jgi:hypothetical protein
VDTPATAPVYGHGASGAANFSGSLAEVEAPVFRIDDILAALFLSLAMLRRLEVKRASRDAFPGVSEQDFARWRALAMRAYNQSAAASLLKVVLSFAWFKLAAPFVPTPFFQLVGLLIFMGWVIGLVSAWRISTDAHQLRRQLGIDLRRRSAGA